MKFVNNKNDGDLTKSVRTSLDSRLESAISSSEKKLQARVGCQEFFFSLAKFKEFSS